MRRRDVLDDMAEVMHYRATMGRLSGSTFGDILQEAKGKRRERPQAKQLDMFSAALAQSQEGGDRDQG